jgi:hypothetical protein
LKNIFQWETPPHRKVKGGENDRSTSLSPCKSKKGNPLILNWSFNFEIKTFLHGVNFEIAHTFFLKNIFQWEGYPHRKVKGGENGKVDEMSVRPILKF